MDAVGLGANAPRGVPIFFRKKNTAGLTNSRVEGRHNKTMKGGNPVAKSTFFLFSRYPGDMFFWGSYLMESSISKDATVVVCTIVDSLSEVLLALCIQSVFSVPT